MQPTAGDGPGPAWQPDQRVGYLILKEAIQVQQGALKYRSSQLRLPLTSCTDASRLSSRPDLGTAAAARA